MTKLQFAFQGGGAKLGCLLAAASAVYHCKRPMDYEITRIAGTSAGAIAAAILATGRDPEIFRARLQEIAPKYIKDIIPNKNFRSLKLLGAAFGGTIYNPVAYKSFLRDLFYFNDIKFEKLSDLDSVNSLFIHSADIRSRSPVIYTNNDNFYIYEALFNSSALPFVFRSFNDENFLVDGGLINNFPSSSLIDDKNYGEVIGFSFPKNPSSFEFKSIGAFAGGLVSTMMDSMTEHAVSRLPPSNVFDIRTETKTFEFELALTRDLDTEYDRHKREISSFLRESISKIRENEINISAAECVSRIISYCKNIEEGQDVDVTNVDVIYYCEGLKSRDPNMKDHLDITATLRAHERPARIFSFEVGVCESSIDEKIADIGLNLKDPSGKTIGATVIPSKIRTEGSIPNAKVVCLFHEELTPEKDYKLHLSASTNEVLYDVLSDTKMDYVKFSLELVASVKTANIIAIIPSDLPIYIEDWPRSERPEGWISGSEIDPTKLSDFNLRPGTKAIGWTAKNLIRGNSVGFCARL